MCSWENHLHLHWKVVISAWNSLKIKLQNHSEKKDADKKKVCNPIICKKYVRNHAKKVKYFLISVSSSSYEASKIIHLMLVTHEKSDPKIIR